ncbi:hypothetical protein [Gemmobacter lutimaris]|uniref:hypothetical protein n=1 Tax=Gemmobacter lutimaris TaxID=2306023 RepID=UPI0018F61862|nr:hypothetical protein [Gemmobacter lutimaris]
MLVKVVLLFLLGMAALAMVFKQLGGRKRLSKPVTCPRCGRHRIGNGPCPCGTARNKG